MDSFASIGVPYALEPLSSTGQRYYAIMESTMPARDMYSPHMEPRNNQMPTYPPAQRRSIPEPNLPPASGTFTDTVSGTATSTGFGSHHIMPEWQRDHLDLEAGCTPWIDIRQAKSLSWFSSKLFASNVEKKARNPAHCTKADFDVRGSSHLLGFCWRFPFFLLYCFLVVTFRKHLGIPCDSTDGSFVDNPDGAQGTTSPSKSTVLIWAEGMIAMGASFLISQGYNGVRGTRQRLELVRHAAVTLAYSFLKTMSADIGGRHGTDELQILIYECLALVTAFPVALLHQIQGNTCEPAVTKYCQQVAKKLKRLRNGQDNVGWSPYNVDNGDELRSSDRQYITVEYFFEIFSLNLDTEYRQQTVKTESPSMAPQYIIYNLRNHLENITDMGNMDDRRTPIIRGNIDILDANGRQCAILARSDIMPIVFLWTIDICCRLIAFGSPIQNCDLLVNSGAPDSPTLEFPRAGALVSYIAMSLISATVMTVLEEMWCLWDPYGRAINTLTWTRGIASEIDHMLNEFYEYDTKTLIRKHAYMGPSAQLNDLPHERERWTV